MDEGKDVVARGVVAFSLSPLLLADPGFEDEDGGAGNASSTAPEIGVWGVVAPVPGVVELLPLPLFTSPFEFEFWRHPPARFAGLFSGLVVEGRGSACPSAVKNAVSLLVRGLVNSSKRLERDPPVDGRYEDGVPYAPVEGDEVEAREDGGRAGVDGVAFGGEEVEGAGAGGEVVEVESSEGEAEMELKRGRDAGRWTLCRFEGGKYAAACARYDVVGRPPLVLPPRLRLRTLEVGEAARGGTEEDSGMLSLLGREEMECEDDLRDCPSAAGSELEAVRVSVLPRNERASSNALRASSRALEDDASEGDLTDLLVEDDILARPPTVLRSRSALVVATELVMSFGRNEGDEGRFASASAVNARRGLASGEVRGEYVSEPGAPGEIDRRDAERLKYDPLSPPV